MSLLGLGEGWNPAILNSEEEFHFVWSKEMQIDDEYVGVGGSTDSSEPRFDYSEYLPNESGIIFRINK